MIKRPDLALASLAASQLHPLTPSHLLAPQYVSNATNYLTSDIDKLLELIGNEVEAERFAFGRLKLVEVRYSSNDNFMFKVFYSDNTLQIYLPRPSQLKISPLASLAAAVDMDDGDIMPVADQRLLQMLVRNILEATRLGFRRRKGIIKRVTSNWTLCYHPRLRRAERAQGEIPKYESELSDAISRQRSIEQEIARLQKKLESLRRTIEDNSDASPEGEVELF